MIRSIMNVKGGVGKTSTAIQLAAGLGKAGKHVLIVDADGQGTASTLLLPDFGFDSQTPETDRTLCGLLNGKRTVNQCIWHTGLPYVDLIPCDLDLFNTIYELQSNSVNGLPQLKLKQILRDLNYDEIIIDNNPSINMMSVNSIYAADQIIIPTSLDVGGLKGVQMTLKHAASIIRELDSNANLDYMILFTLVNHNNLEKEIAEHMKTIYMGHVYTQQIHYQAAPFRNANFNYKTVLDNRRARVALEYRSFVNEVLGITEENAGDQL